MMVQEFDFNTLMSKIDKKLEFCGIKLCKDLIIVMLL